MISVGHVTNLLVLDRSSRHSSARQHTEASNQHSNAGNSLLYIHAKQAVQIDRLCALRAKSSRRSSTTLVSVCPSGC